MAEVYLEHHRTVKS